MTLSVRYLQGFFRDDPAANNSSFTSELRIKGKTFICENMASQMRHMGVPSVLMDVNVPVQEYVGDIIKNMALPTSVAEVNLLQQEFHVPTVQKNKAKKQDAHELLVGVQVRTMRVRLLVKMLIWSLRTVPSWQERDFISDKVVKKAMKYVDLITRPGAKNHAIGVKDIATAISALMLAMFDLYYEDMPTIQEINNIGKQKAMKRRIADYEDDPFDLDDYNYEYHNYEFSHIRVNSELIPHRRRFGTKKQNNVSRKWIPICKEYNYTHCFYDALENGYCQLHRNCEFKSKDINIALQLHQLMDNNLYNDGINFLFVQTRIFQIRSSLLARTMHYLHGIPLIKSRWWSAMGCLFIKLAVPKQLHKLCCHFLAVADSLCLFPQRRFISVCAAVVYLIYGLEDIAIDNDVFELYSCTSIENCQELISQMMSSFDSFLPLDYTPKNALPHLRLFSSRSGQSRSIPKQPKDTRQPIIMSLKQRLNMLQRVTLAGTYNADEDQANQFDYMEDLKCWIPQQLDNNGNRITLANAMKESSLPPIVYTSTRVNQVPRRISSVMTPFGSIQTHEEESQQE